MGKAFTEQEREMVRERLKKVGLRMFAEQGIKKISIRELAREVGIAQGGFYSFYESKEAFLIDLMQIRIREKLEIIEKKREETLGDPVGFMVELFYREGMHLKENKAFNNEISDSLRFFLNVDAENIERMNEQYRSFLERMMRYWKEQGREVRADVNGLMNVITAVGIMFTNADLMDADYFPEIYRAFCDSSVRLYIELRETPSCAK